MYITYLIVINVKIKVFFPVCKIYIVFFLLGDHDDVVERLLFPLIVACGPHKRLNLNKVITKGNENENTQK